MFNNATNQTEEQTQVNQAAAPAEEQAAAPTQTAAAPATEDNAVGTQQTQTEQKPDLDKTPPLTVPKPTQEEPAGIEAEAATTPSAAEEEDETNAAPTTETSAPTASPDELLALKQTALEQLSPLVPHLEQSAEERFRTLMMMIQAADDHTKIKDAYQAAQKIEDDKVRAQALLDVVNEINYFTQKKD